METSCGTTYLFHEDRFQVHNDLEFLKSIEKNAFQLVLSEGLNRKINIDEDKLHEDIKSLIEGIKSYGSCLLITDYIYDSMDILQIPPQKLNEIRGEFDSVVINLNKSVPSQNDDVIVKFVLDTIDKIKVGGSIYIPKTSYDALPNGRLGAEALVRVLNLKIKIPRYDFSKILIASKI